MHKCELKTLFLFLNSAFYYSHKNLDMIQGRGSECMKCIKSAMQHQHQASAAVIAFRRREKDWFRTHWWDQEHVFRKWVALVSCWLQSAFLTDDYTSDAQSSGPARPREVSPPTVYHCSCLSLRLDRDGTLPSSDRRRKHPCQDSTAHSVFSKGKTTSIPYIGGDIIWDMHPVFCSYYVTELHYKIKVPAIC